MSPIQAASWRTLALLSAAGAMACGDARPTAPDAAPPHPSLSLTNGDSAAIASALSDLQSRITPTLGSTEEASRLDGAIGRVSAAIAAHDRDALESSLAEGDAAVDALVGEKDGAAPQDLDVVRFVLAQGRALLTAPPEGLVAASSPRATHPAAR